MKRKKHYVTLKQALDMRRCVLWPDSRVRSEWQRVFGDRVRVEWIEFRDTVLLPAMAERCVGATSRGVRLSDLRYLFCWRLDGARRHGGRQTPQQERLALDVATALSEVAVGGLALVDGKVRIGAGAARGTKAALKRLGIEVAK